MSLMQQGQLLFAEATALPYDPSRIQKARVALYRIGNAFDLPISDMVQSIKKNGRAVEVAALELLEQSEEIQVLSIMGTLSTQVGWISAHLCTPVEYFNIPQLGSDIFAFLNTLAVLERFTHLKVH